MSSSGALFARPGFKRAKREKMQYTPGAQVEAINNSPHHFCKPFFISYFMNYTIKAEKPLSNLGTSPLQQFFFISLGFIFEVL